MNNILLVGGCGYIGTMLSQRLKNKNKITILDLNSNDGNIINGNIKNISQEFLSQYDVILYFAGNSSVKSSNNIFSSIENNVNNLLRIFKLCTSQKIIYASSSSVYGDTKNETVNEEYTNYDSHNYYDLTKKILDIYAIEIIKDYKKKIYGLRLGTVNGYSPNFRNDIMINAMTNNAIKNKVVKLYSKQTRRPILGIQDLCRAVETIIEKGTEENAGIYNLASFNSNVEEIGNEVARITNTQCIYLDEVKTEISNVKLETSTYDFNICCEKFKKEFKFEFTETIESIVNSILDNTIIINQPRFNDIYYDYVFSSVRKSQCRVCDNKNIKCILDLGEQPLANNFTNNLLESESFPLKLMLCNTCYHLQLSEVVNPNILYKNYIYVSGTSNTLVKYFDNLSDYIISDSKSGTIVEIACNDGSQLNIFKEKNWVTIGVDPAENLYQYSSKKSDIYCSFWNIETSEKIKERYNTVDVILCQNVFAHTDNINEFLESCKLLMNDKTRLYIQVSQANLVRDNQFDTVYHEHLSFFNINSMNYIVNRNGLYINKITKPPIHGVSYLFEIGRVEKPNTNLHELLEEERNIGLMNIDTYTRYSNICQQKCLDFKINILNHIKQGYTIVGYGASAKGNTLLNYLNLTNKQIKFIVDDSKAKQGLYTPGSKILIKDKSVLSSIDKLAVLMITWNFKDEIIKKVESVRKDAIYIYY